MAVINPFANVPGWMGNVVASGMWLGGAVLVALGVRQANRRRLLEAARRGEAEAAAHANLVTLHAVLESTPDAVWGTGPDGRFLLANTSFADLVGLPLKAVVGLRAADLANAGSDERGQAAARALGSSDAERYETTVSEPGIEPRTFLISKSPIRAGDGHRIGTLGVARDISDRKAAEEKLMRQAHHDGLTGLPNRAAFRDRVSRQLARWRHRPDHPFAVLFLDIDHFKDVNDKYGHAAGDELLRAFGAALDHWLRPGDFVARYGGDEFTALLQDVRSRADAETVAGRILVGLQKPFHLESVPALQTTTSIGIVIVDPALDSVDALLQAADAAMYQAKATGRARLVSA